jgi:hypothetical protein
MLIYSRSLNLMQTKRKNEAGFFAWAPEKEAGRSKKLYAKLAHPRGKPSGRVFRAEKITYNFSVFLLHFDFTRILTQWEQIQVALDRDSKC